ncbi:MAG: DUF4998 domain-containing protein [Solitalea sp.]
MKLNIQSAVLAVLLLTGLFACTKEDDYKKYTKDGEITYPGRVDTVIVHPGDHRVLLEIALGSDPAVTRLRAFWNEGADSVELPITHNTGRDTVELSIEGLSEGQYNFMIYTYDAKENVSVVKRASGNVYGENYRKALSNRTLSSLAQSPDGARILINWSSPLVGEAGIVLNYTNADGIARSLIIPASETNTELPSYKEESVLEYRSFFLPEPDAADTFFMEYAQVTLPVYERQLAKDQFQPLLLPTDMPEGGYGWLMEYLWNENYGVPGFATANGGDQWFSFDSGTSVRPSRMKTWQASDRLYKDQNVKRFEIWGSNDPAADGSWDSWTLLMTCESTKPSGLPLGQVTDQDVAYAAAGEEFIFPEGTPAVRYYRIKVLETWDSSQPFITMSELSFWTHDRP